ncbi:MAG: MATE family efflux transporter, partial [Lachnospiraceae bacterium]|nr:MATE family efflux transporter [Lachnospiraceae bacterium]
STGQIAAGYLWIVAFSYIPMAAEALLATLLRCMEAASLPLFASVFGAMVNTGLNYVLIFGKFGFPRMGVNGAAWATVASRIAGCALCIVLFSFYYGRYYRKKEIKLEVSFHMGKGKRVQYMGILLPILLCELFWSLGENVYTAIYGNMGTQACAAMTLTVPVQALMIGALSGIAQATGILIGKFLGGGEYEKAYQNSKKLMGYGLAGSVLLSIMLVAAGRFYVQIYQVEDTVKILGNHILIAFALISPVKVQNMILGGGVLRSGGKTKYVMVIDFVGTWLFGVPLGFLAAFVWKLEIPYVYFILSLEECVRLFISIMVFRRRTWMKNIGALNED